MSKPVPIPLPEEVGSLSVIAWDPEFQTRSRWRKNDD